MNIFSTIISGFGLSAPAGLNAWIPLMVTGIAGKIGAIKLQAPFDLLTNTWVLAILAASAHYRDIRGQDPGGRHDQ